MICHDSHGIAMPMSGICKIDPLPAFFRRLLRDQLRFSGETASAPRQIISGLRVLITVTLLGQSSRHLYV